MFPSDVDRINSDVTYTVCVQFGQFIAKFDDGSCVLVPHKYDEWVVDYQRCSLASLQKDFAARVNWGSNQEVEVSVFDKSINLETRLENDSVLRAFFDRCVDRRLYLFADVVDKSAQVISNSGLTVVSHSGVESAAYACSNSQLESASNVISPNVDVPFVDWDALEIVPITEELVGSIVPVVDEDNFYEHIGLRAEDERVEKGKDRLPDEVACEGALDVEGAAIPCTDTIPGEDAIFYDKEDPPMTVGSTYASMNEFRSAVRQHAIKGQFEVWTRKSDTCRFRGYCIAKGCPWFIVARLMHDEKSVRVTMNNFDHLCASTGRVKTRMTTYRWIAEKSIPFLKKDPNMGAKKLQEELEDKYNVKLGYSTVWAGRQKAVEQIFGTWEESFADLYRFKAEIDAKMPGSVVDLEVQEEEDDRF
ncbi:uncharacterized protein [Zea mays]|uniref:Transposase MuDR plant domain-containing protein n=1 Tax=Zea mays TaxID=4577 RepID=A0A1D6GG57_MAIZE|nr:uncharacterized protein LOC103625826 isoform X4 [Zea mays]AQK62532.1 hypothetical protein ZEAMMB73_Zm00001d013125 [Zea mays]|eukprot:XP_008644448.1 uncharacterized protein LOC103625826 isoform X4 [Zea mays]